MTRSSAWGFGTRDANSRRQAKAQRALDRARKRQLAADKKRNNKILRLETRRRKRQEAKWKKVALHRRRADDKRIRIERRKFQKEQKRQTLGGGWGPGRQRGENASARRAAHNLLTLANSIGVRFTKEDTDQLLAYADQELASSGSDLATIYQELTQQTFIGRRIKGVVGQYDISDVESGDRQTMGDRVLERVEQAAELLGQWERTKSVEQSVALGVAITQTLGATPEAIKADQRDIETDAGKEAYNEMVTMYQGKSRLWTAVHMLLHPEDRLENVSESAREQLDADFRAEDASQARLIEARTGTGESASVQNNSWLDRLRSLVGI